MLPFSALWAAFAQIQAAPPSMFLELGKSESLVRVFRSWSLS